MSELRKVLYQTWIPKQSIPLPKDAYQDDILLEQMYPATKPGTGCFSEPQSGYFHAWGIETIELAEDSLANTIAIVEDVTTGHVHKVDPSKMRFVQPPVQDAKSHWSKEHVHTETTLGVDLNKFDSLEKEFKNE